MAFLTQWGKEPGSDSSKILDAGTSNEAEGSGAPGRGGPAAEPQNTATLQSIVAEHLRMIARAHAWGVTIGVGTDGGAPGVSWPGGYWLELSLLSQAAFAPEALLRLATLNGAAVLGLERERGSIAVGKPPYWLCLDMGFLRGRIEPQTLKGIIYPVESA
jgi:imidazolonepropionase-like amidohydrolase